MKKILIILLLIALKGQSQTPINYTKINQRYDWLSGKFDSTLHVPFGSSPAIRGGGYNWPGAVFLDTLGVDSGLYYFNRGWVQVGKNYLAGTGLTLTSTTFKVDTVPIATRLRVQKGIDSLGALITAGSVIDAVLALGGTFSANRTMDINTHEFRIASGAFLSKFYYDTVGALVIENNAGALVPGHNSPALWIRNTDASNSEQIGFLNNNGQNVGDIGTSNLDSSFQIRANVPTKFLQIAMHPTTGYNMPIFRLQNNGAINWVSYNNASTVNWNAKFDLYNNKYIFGDTVDVSDATNNYKLQVKGDVALNAANPKIHFRATGVTQPYTTGDFPASGVGRILPVSSTTGGLLISGFSSGDNLPLLFQGIIGSTTPTGSPIIFRAYKSDGATSVVGLGNTEKIFSIQNSSTETFGQLGDGTTTLSKYAGTGTRLPNVSSAGVLGAITNGSDGEVMTLVSGAPAWAAAGGGSSTTINNNADDRVITGSGSANTLNGESRLTYDTAILSIHGYQPLIYFRGLTGNFSQPATVGGLFPATLGARFGLLNSTAGGLLGSGFTQGDVTPFLFQGIIGSTAPANPTISFVGYKSDGADGLTALGASEKIVTFANSSTVMLSIIGDGGTTLGGYAGTGDDLAYFNSAGKFVRSSTEITNVATLASPTFTGTPAAPTAAGGTNTTQIATTAFVTTAVTNATLSGSYTPTLFNTTNVAASTAYTCYWYRVNDMVTVFGEVDIDPTTTLTATELGFSLPTGANASNLADDGELSGTAASAIAAEAIAILGDVTNDRASIKYLCTDISNHTLRIHFSYKVTAP